MDPWADQICQYLNLQIHTNGDFITVNNYGKHYRDFTFIDDAIKCIYKLLKLNEFHKVDRKRNKFFKFSTLWRKKDKNNQLIEV